jgi:hypothetical protein
VAHVVDDAPQEGNLVCLGNEQQIIPDGLIALRRRI